MYGQVSLNKGGKVGIEDNLIKEAYKVRVTGVVMIWTGIPVSMCIGTSKTEKRNDEEEDSISLWINCLSRISVVVLVFRVEGTPKKDTNISKEASNRSKENLYGINMNDIKSICIVRNLVHENVWGVSVSRFLAPHGTGILTVLPNDTEGITVLPLRFYGTDWKKDGDISVGIFRVRPPDIWGM